MKVRKGRSGESLTSEEGKGVERDRREENGLTVRITKINNGRKGGGIYREGVSK